jgi:stearoyl-CoA desaturase (delta-9 desaturase)
MTRSKLNWTNTLFLTVTPLFAITGTIFLIMHHAVQWPTILLALFFIATTGLSITCGYHRLFSHSTYQAHFLVRLFYLLFGAAAFEGSVAEWCTDHRDHHRYTDTDKDPYDATKGFWFSHIGWLLRLDYSKRKFDNIDDLKSDPLIRWQHKYYVYIAVVMGFIVPTLIATLWGDPFGGLVFAAALRIVLNQHLTFFINSVCHIFGKRSYSDRNTARDNWFTALFTYGEGYHNFHHKFPIDYRNGIRFYDFDPSKWLIKLLSLLGLAHDLKTVSTQRIITCRLEMDEKQLQEKVHSNSRSEFLVRVAHARAAVLEALSKLESFEKAYEEFKQTRLDYVTGKISGYRESLRYYRAYLRKSKRDLNDSLKVWSQLMTLNHQ